MTHSRRLPDPNAPLLEQMGGPKGLLFSSIPILTFVPINAVWGLDAAMWGAIGVAAAMFLWSLVRNENLQPAISGFIGVAICVLIAWRTGDARGYFLYGIIVQAVYGTALAVSCLVRWPLVGVIWGFLQGTGQGWRADRVQRRWYAVATWFWAGLFAFRFVIQSFLYAGDEVGWLGAARIAMGWPLAIVGFAVTVWAVKKATDARHEAEEAAADDAAADPSVAPGGTTDGADGSGSGSAADTDPAGDVPLAADETVVSVEVDSDGGEMPGRAEAGDPTADPRDGGPR